MIPQTFLSKKICLSSFLSLAVRAVFESKEGKSNILARDLIRYVKMSIMLQFVINKSFETAAVVEYTLVHDT